MRVLVTDATYKHTLAAVRSLGRRGIEVVVGGSRKLGQAFYSRYCREKIIYPDPQDHGEFADYLLRYVSGHEIDVLLPIGYLACVALSRHIDEFKPYVSMPVADWEFMETAADKKKTMAFARGIGIPSPITYAAKDEVDRYPVVVKQAAESGGLRYVNSATELARIDTTGAVIQEYIPGRGYGFFALFDHGRCKAFFMHGRRREYPPTGGASTAAESIFDPALKQLGLKLLQGLRWHGVAMVEFKKDTRDGLFKLMEVNPKFWGSLDLAISSGVDFPYLAVQMALGEDPGDIFEYEIGRKFRWFFPDDLMHLLAHPSSLGRVLGDFFNRDTRGNLWWRDPKPNLFQAVTSIPIILSRVKAGNFRYPHGIPGAPS